jgi:hypothetical protein
LVVDGLIPVDGLSSAEMRRQIESATEADPQRLQELDAALWLSREQEQVEEGVPVLLGKLKRTRLINSDRISTTWDAWETATGLRHAVRVLRPHLRKDPIWRRRLQRGAQLARSLTGILPVLSQADSDWPRLFVALPGSRLADLLPAEDLPDPLEMARFLVGGLKGLECLQAAGLVHGNIGPENLVNGPDRVQLLWLDPFLPEQGSLRQDLSALGTAVAQLDPHGVDPIGALAHSWGSNPPPSLEMAKSVLMRSLASLLANNRHHMRMRSRHVHARQGEARLLRAVRALGLALSPPIATVCLRAGQDGVLVVAQSDGQQVKGGGLAALPIRHLPIIWSAERGLDASASRMLLRSFATRRTGDESRREAAQQALGGTDEMAKNLCRWLSAQARLRSAAKLLQLSRKTQPTPTSAALNPSESRSPQAL